MACLKSQSWEAAELEHRHRLSPSSPAWRMLGRSGQQGAVTVCVFLWLRPVLTGWEAGLPGNRSA